MNSLLQQPHISQRAAAQRFVWLAAALAILLSTLFATGCSRTDPEKALRAAIRDVETAIKAKDTAKVMSFLADDFARTGSGGMNKQESRRVLAAAFLTSPNLYVNVTIRDVAIQGEQATTTLIAVAGGGTGLIPERAQSWQFVTKWRMDGGKWLAYSSEWTELL